MKKLSFSFLFILMATLLFAQNVMTPELLWKLGRVGAEQLSADGKTVYFGITYPNVDENKSTRNIYKISTDGGVATPFISSDGSTSSLRKAGESKIIYNQKGVWMIANADGSAAAKIDGLPEDADNVQVSPDGNSILFTNEVKVSKVAGSDFYPNLKKSNIKIYTSLNDRHWDNWEDGMYSHVFVAKFSNGKVESAKDIMNGQEYDCPQKPSGGAEDVIWSPDSKNIVYVVKQRTGTAYAVSTNTDILMYNLPYASLLTLSAGMNGYDIEPQFSTDGSKIAWLSMSRDGYEADKNNLIIMDVSSRSRMDVTSQWDGTVGSFKWATGVNNKIYFAAYSQGTEQLFSADFPISATEKKAPFVFQITSGDFDINGLVGQVGNKMVVSRTDMNHAAELYNVDLTNGSLTQLTHVNDDIYKKITMGKIEKQWVTTTDGQKMLVWVILPPNFDAAKKYPTLLYCQGGPQSALSQFYSFRWNFQLMAAQGYVVVAPNRRGMPGHGVKWNEAISKDWGGQSIQDYLTAIDSVSEKSYVDKSRRAAVGASYGGYSVYMLAGVHNNRFRSFIAHDGVFDTRSWYGTTEEIWFSNWDMGGPYWEKKNEKSYTTFNPSTYVDKWNTPILIYQGGKDFRTPIEQSLQAFQAAQLKGIKSKLVYLPEENHWVMSSQNALIWQHEFYSWLEETLK